MVSRNPALKVRIKELINGKFLKGSKDELKPNYVIDKFGRKISRVNIIATVIDKFLSFDNSYMTITVDDGSGSIRVKFFGEDVKNNSEIKVGDELLIVGKIKEYNEEIYISPEIIRKVEDLNYISFRRLEVLKNILHSKEIVDRIKGLVLKGGIEAVKSSVYNFGLDEESLDFILSNELEDKKTNLEEIVINIIKNLDNGDGVDLDKILKESGLKESEADYIITKLLDEGIIFEPRVGKFKLVEVG